MMLFFHTSNAQDTLFTKKGKPITGKVNEIYKNAYVLYTPYNSSKQLKINCDALYYISLQNNTKIFYSPKPVIFTKHSFDSIVDPFILGGYITPLGMHTGIYLTYYLNRKNFLKLSTGYKIYCPQAFDEFFYFMQNQASGFYTGPIIQLRWAHFKEEAPHKGIRTRNLVYDFRYRKVNQYTWLDGPTGQNSTYMEERSEQVYAHSLVYMLATSYHLNSTIDWGLILGVGLQWGHKRIHHYAAPDNYFTPRNHIDRFSSEPLVPVIFRTGLFFEFKGLSK